MPVFFDGSGNLDHLVPMRRNLNRGDWRSMENTWKKASDQGKKVQVEIKINYSGASQRPISLDVRYKIGKDNWINRNFEN